MDAALYYVLIGWHALLIAALALRAARAGALVTRAIALDTMALVFVAALAIIAVREGRADYLDIGLVLAMLGFAQTVSTARFARGSARDG